MSRFIDADELYERTSEWEAQALHLVEIHANDEDPKEWKKWSYILGERSAFKHDIVDSPTLDIVEIVRCKDCVHCADDWNGNQPMFTCEIARCGESVQPNDYCSYGERRTE